MLRQLAEGNVRAALNGTVGVVVIDPHFEADAHGEAQWNRVVRWAYGHGFEIDDDPVLEQDDGTTYYVLHPTTEKG